MYLHNALDVEQIALKIKEQPADRPGAGLASEERQYTLHAAVGDRERLNAQLLLNLQRLQTRGLFTHVCVDQGPHAPINRIDQLRNEIVLHFDPVDRGPEVGCRGRHDLQGAVHGRNHLIQVSQIGIDAGQPGNIERRDRIGDAAIGINVVNTWFLAIMLLTTWCRRRKKAEST